MHKELCVDISLSLDNLIDICQEEPGKGIIMRKSIVSVSILLLLSSFAFANGAAENAPAIATLDSARLRRAISSYIGIDQKPISAYALSEHGESQFATWSQAAIGGKLLYQLMKQHLCTYGRLDLDGIEENGRHTGWVILEGKGSTEFGIGASIAEAARTILGNEHRILPVSAYLDGEYGFSDTICSVPCVLGSEGIESVIELELDQSPTGQSPGVWRIAGP